MQLAKTNCKINVWENNIEFLTSQYCHTENITISNPVFENIGGCAIVYGEHKTSNACVIFCPNTKKCKTVLFEQIELDNKTVKLLYDLQTFPGHKVLKTYSLSETKFELQNFELYCTPDKSRKNPPSEIIPFLFLECIRAKDFCFAKKFVCESLENTSAASFEKYFGEFEHINLHSITPLTYVLYSSSNANVFEFVLQNDKITEINKV